MAQQLKLRFKFALDMLVDELNSMTVKIIAVKVLGHLCKIRGDRMEEWHHTGPDMSLAVCDRLWLDWSQPTQLLFEFEIHPKKREK